MKSVEEICRELLVQAIKDGLVREHDPSEFGNGDPDPMTRTAGDMCGMANLLVEALDEAARIRELGDAIEYILNTISKCETVGEVERYGSRAGALAAKAGDIAARLNSLTDSE